MNESDDAKIYDHQLVLADAPYLPLTFLLKQLAYFIFPEVDQRGNEIPFGNNMHDVNGETRNVYSSHLRSTLVEAINREEIIEKIWGEDKFPSNRTVDNYIVKLRKWCESDSHHAIEIQSIRSIGYKLIIN